MNTCATLSATLGEPLTATAPTAATWLFVEQPGPWGRDALTSSHLDPTFARALTEATAPHGIRVGLIRRPGPHADQGGETRQVFLAHTRPGNSWLYTGRLPMDPGTLLQLDFAALGAGDQLDTATSGWEPYGGGPLTLVCTNGKRDRCCALQGRPLALELASSAANVWETTHLGGHRFAPTLLVLPYGYAYGRVGASVVKAVLEAAREGQVRTEGCRGRSAWERPGQAADLAIRETLGEQPADALDVTRTEQLADGEWDVTVVHTDGRSWRVRVRAVMDLPESPASCGATPAVPTRMRVESVELGFGPG